MMDLLATRDLAGCRHFRHGPTACSALLVAFTITLPSAPAWGQPTAEPQQTSTTAASTASASPASTTTSTQPKLQRQALQRASLAVRPARLQRDVAERGRNEASARGANRNQVSASIGEGGRDLATRVRAPIGPSGARFVGFELHAAAGPAPALLASDLSYLRLQPIAVIGLRPTAAADLYVGAGAGASVLWAADAASPGQSPQSAEGIAPTGTLLLGARLDTEVAPVVLEARADGVSKHGGAVMLTVALELCP